MGYRYRPDHYHLVGNDELWKIILKYPKIPFPIPRKYSRNRVFELLKENDIVARKYFYPLTNDIACYADMPTAGMKKTPVAKYIGDRILTLPLYSDLSISEVDRICEIILK